MKYLLLFALVLPGLLCCECVYSQNLSDNRDNPDNAVNGDAIRILASPELSNLTADWVSGYKKLNPGATFAIGNIHGNEISQAGAICFLSTDSFASPSDWKIRIGHNVIVPVMNAKNPMFNEIVDQGISNSKFASLFSGTGKMNWSDLIRGGQNTPVHLYIIDNAEIKKSVADFIQKDPAAFREHLITDNVEFMAAISQDPYAIGFCRLSDVRNEDLKEINENIRLLPIDKNGNGRIDYFENIFNSADDLSRGVWVGKYPPALSGNIYAVSQTKPTDDNAIAFLT